MKVGDVVDDFTAVDHTGASVRLSDYLGEGPVVLFFYPAAMTAGCTVESCHFRDLAAEFAELAATPVGISPDEADKQARFRDKHTLGYPLLADPDRAIADLFGVRGGMLGLSPVKRATFVIGQDRRVLETVKSEMNMNAHADKALDYLRKS